MCWELNIKVQLISGRKKLMPNIIIVFYAGSSFWKAPQRLQEMMDKSKSMEKYYNAARWGAGELPHRAGVRKRGILSFSKESIPLYNPREKGRGAFPLDPAHWQSRS